jgi:hypothetical protein
MQGIGRILIILVVVIAAGFGGSLLVLPSTAAKSQGFDVAMAPQSVIARLSTAAPNTVVGAGVTQSGRPTVANNVVTTPIAFADGATGKATYTVTPKNGGAHVDARIERDLGFNPLTRFQGMNGAPVETAAAVFFPAVSNDLTHPTDGGRDIDGTTSQGLSYEVVNVAAQQFAFNEYCAPQQPSEIKEAVRQSLVAVRAFMGSHNLAASGQPVAVETGWNEQTHQYCFQIGVPFNGAPPRNIYVAGVKVGPTPAGQAMRVHYSGTEENVIPVYDQMENAMWSAHVTIVKSYEVYYDDPLQPAGSQNRDIYYLFTGDAATLQRVAPSAGAPPPAGVTPAAATTAATDTTTATATSAATTTSTATTATP